MAYCAVHPRSLNIFLNSYFFSQSQTLSPLSVTRAAWHVVCLKSKICLPLIHFCSAWILPPSVKISPVIWRGGKLDTVLQPGPVPITSCVSCWQYVGKTGPGDKVLDRHYIDSTRHICGLKLGINWQSQLLFSSINLCSLDTYDNNLSWTHVKSSTEASQWPVRHHVKRWDNNTVIRLLIDQVPVIWANNWSVHTARMNFMVWEWWDVADMRTLLLSPGTGHVPSGSGASSRGHTTLIISSVTTGDRYVRERNKHICSGLIFVKIKLCFEIKLHMLQCWLRPADKCSSCPSVTGCCKVKSLKISCTFSWVSASAW